MTRIATLIRKRHGRSAKPTMVMIDAQTVRGGRPGPTFHEAGGRGGRTNGTKRSIVIEILGLPLAVQVGSAKPHDVRSGRELLAKTLPEPRTVKAIVADRGCRGLNKMAAKKGVKLDIKAPPKGTVGFTPIAPLYRVEHTRLRAPGPLAAAVTLLRRIRRECSCAAGGVVGGGFGGLLMRRVRRFHPALASSATQVRARSSVPASRRRLAANRPSPRPGGRASCSAATDP